MCMLCLLWDIPGDSVVKTLPANAGDEGLIPGLGRSPEEGNDNLLQYFFLGNPMDRGAWRAIVHGSQRVGHNLATEQQQLQRSALGQFQFFIFCSINMK